MTTVGSLASHGLSILLRTWRDALTEILTRMGATTTGTKRGEENAKAIPTLRILNVGINFE